MMGKNSRINKSITFSQMQAAWGFCPVVASCSSNSFSSRLGDLCCLPPLCKGGYRLQVALFGVFLKVRLVV